MTFKQPDHIDLLAVRLHEEIKIFKQTLGTKKKDLSKNDLINMLIAIVSFPVEEVSDNFKIRIENNNTLKHLTQLALEAKQTTTHLAIEQLALEAKGNNYGL